MKKSKQGNIVTAIGLFITTIITILILLQVPNISNNIIFLFVFILALCFFMAIAILNLYRFILDCKAKTNGVEAKGRISRLWKQQRDNPGYFLEAIYTDQYNVRRAIEIKVRLDIYRDLRVDDEIDLLVYKTQAVLKVS